jgi:hypothetical protein
MLTGPIHGDLEHLDHLAGPDGQAVRFQHPLEHVRIPAVPGKSPYMVKMVKMLR